MTAEEKRLLENERRTKYWSRWGPYLSDRAWGTVREDYSANGTAWDYLPHDHARSRAYRWNEDGLGGISDRHQRICFAVALWNERDPILKERLFGLTGNEGNHGEDVKECYFHLDSTPTHSYMKFLYKYPQAEYPYRRLLEENRRRDKLQPEFELVDTGIFNESRYFDVFVEYAKATPDDILIEISVVNRGPDAAAVRLLPTDLVPQRLDLDRRAVEAGASSGAAGRSGERHFDRGTAPRHEMAVRGRRARTAVHGQRDEYQTTVQYRRHGLRQGRDQRLRRRRPHGCRLALTGSEPRRPRTTG